MVPPSSAVSALSIVVPNPLLPSNESRAAIRAIAGDSEAQVSWQGMRGIDSTFRRLYAFFKYKKVFHNSKN